MNRTLGDGRLCVKYFRPRTSKVTSDTDTACASRPAEAWQMRIHLSAGDYVDVSQFAGAPAKPYVLAAFVDVVRMLLPEVLLGQVEARAFARAGVQVPAGRRNRGMTERRLNEVDRCTTVERVARVGVAHPVW